MIQTAASVTLPSFADPRRTYVRHAPSFLNIISNVHAYGFRSLDVSRSSCMTSTSFPFYKCRFPFFYGGFILVYAGSNPHRAQTTVSSACIIQSTAPHLPHLPPQQALTPTGHSSATPHPNLHPYRHPTASLGCGTHRHPPRPHQPCFSCVGSGGGGAIK